MSRWLLALVVTAGAMAHATPSGRKWFFPACNPPAVTCPATMDCLSSHCVPRVNFAATIDNKGGTSINGGIDPNSGTVRPGIPLTTFFSRAPEAFRNWTGPRVASCGTTWEVTFGANFATPAGRAALSSTDGQNSVIWLTGTSWVLSSATLALTTTNFYTATDEIFDADMEMNNNIAWSTDMTAGTYDMESVVLHEAGHFLGLDHTLGAYIAVMFPNVTPGASKRALAAVDANDVCTVYPTSSVGATCTPGPNACTGGLVCEGFPGAGKTSCVQDCTTANPNCPQGYSCRTSTDGKACLPQVGAEDECHFCTTGQDCSTGVCLMEQDTGITYCSRLCVDDTQCSTGYTCTSTGAGRYCLPNARCTNQCTNSTQCAVDYTCTQGACIPNANVGDHCEITAFCRNCGTCVGAGNGTGFCRQCCATGGGQTACKACPAVACANPLTCQALSSGDSACLAAVPAPGVCQTCGTNNTCADGLTCVAGRCHADCNPASPGSCASCMTLAQGGGVCACPDEVATTGEPCGNVGGGVAGCAQGLVCIGTPQTLCRARCDPTVPESCPTGESCQLMSTIGVCLPGAAGNRCAACNNAGQCNAGLTCYLGRCYENCNVNVGNTCSTCVQTDANGVGICGCADQLSPADGPCGNQPEVHSCQPGTKCFNGLCRSQCDPAAPTTCPQNTDCLQVGNVYYCQDHVATGGGQGGGGGSTATGGGTARTGGGTGGGGNKDPECGCSTPGPLVLVLAAAMLRRRRRR